ncbi:MULTISPECIES: sigma factor-like helix-turn-helix DNA-binding protein [Brevibacillus]|uniref:sigma factor-like helix-turn-helix DNA-binding protein n=1 Tax=Brevibacillus TaxID=55080 RepID=UPI000ED95A20|nr:sigma factor-like helix-turn-helix DNA-binding protein [Brevibacillus sp.]HBZ79262.1 RNA polymerase subunit sigma-24 [Brevibacillus sp.]
MENLSLKETFSKQLQRIAWRLQYQAKKVYRRESALEDVWSKDEMNTVDSNLFVEELLQSLPERGRYIIQKVVIEGIPEKEVAKHLQISQKRVNVCKTKYLQALRQKISA